MLTKKNFAHFVKKGIYGTTGFFASLSVRKQKLIDNFTLYRKHPKNLIPTEEVYFKNELARACNSVSLHQVKNSFLVVDEGLVIKNFHILSASLIAEHMRYWLGLDYYVKALKTSEILKGKQFLHVYNHFGVGYGHWLADILPRLYVIKNLLPSFTILLPENYNTFHIRTLAPFGISENNIQYLKSGNTYKIEDLSIVDHVGGSCNTKDEVLQELRSFYLDFYIGNKWPAPYKKIYVSRARQKNRKVVNEAEVETLMRSAGFEIFFPEEHSFEEQVRIFASCKVLVGLTGSGITNMLFMQNGASVVEFKMKEDFTNLHYFSMASGMNLDYYYLLCDVKGEDRFTADFIVDIENLSSIVKNFE